MEVRFGLGSNTPQHHMGACVLTNELKREDRERPLDLSQTVILRNTDLADTEAQRASIAPVDLGWLRPGGRLCLLEPNGRNPLIWLQSRIVPAEAGARASECRLGKGGEARECEQRQGHEQR